jgi:poly(A) polymerase
MVSRKDVDPFNNEDWHDLQRYRSGMPRDRAPVGQLSPQPWFTAPQTHQVIAALQAGGKKVRFVGGCVRDSLAGKPVKDVDIATPDSPETVIALLEGAGLRAIPTGIDHGTITALCDGETYEITTLREDVETDGRHAVVAWTNDWMADAARRDLTINALSASPEGAVYDYFDGLQDLAHGRVRFVGRAMDRISEDALRILRFFRFHGRYGRGSPNADALEACRAQVAALKDLSGERIAQELLKILAAPSATEIMLAMQGIRVLATILPELKNIGALRQLVFLETRGLCLPGLAPDPLRRLSCLIGSAVEAEAVADRLRLSNSQRHRLVAVFGLEMPPLDLPHAAFRRILRRSGGVVMADVLLRHWAEQRAVEARTNATQTEVYRQRLEDAFSWDAPRYPLQGRDLLAAGLPPGPELGRLLAAGERYWEEQDFAPSAADILAHLLGAPA